MQVQPFKMPVVTVKLSAFLHIQYFDFSIVAQVSSPPALEGLHLQGSLQSFLSNQN